MKLKIPFYPQSTDINCGVYALAMVLSYFDSSLKLDKIESEIEVFDKVGIPTISLATAAKRLGYPVDMYTLCGDFNEENLKLPYYQQNPEVVDIVKRVSKVARETGVNIIEKSLNLEEILSKISEDCVPIVLLNWKTFVGGEGYHGHIVPIIGYDEDYVYVHDQGRKNPKSSVAIEKDLFEKMRTSPGTDEDILFIHRKKEE